ncbi:unnamed protein product, partial [Oppiella nova]
TCEQCKQRCAFDRKDPESRKKVEGKLLCWLCTLSYKRALAKAKQNDSSIRHTSMSGLKSRDRSSGGSGRHHSKDEMRSHHRHQRSRTGSSSNAHIGGASAPGSSSTAKKPRIDLTKPSNGTTSMSSANTGSLITTGNSSSMADSSMDPNSSETMVTVTQLREQVLALNKLIKTKDRELLNKDKEVQ